MRPWSTVLRIPTDTGDLWFKANMSAQAYEAAVVQILAERRPDLVPRLLAVEPERGWMLQVDGGELLRGLVDGTDHGVWVEILPRYAELQIDLTGDQGRLLATGAPDRRLVGLPAQFEELAARAENLGLSAEEAAGVRGLVPRVAHLGDQLAALGLAETIQHDDLHDGQVFVQDGRFLFFDWGDSCVSHPFFTLLVTFAVLAHRLGVELESSDLDRFRDAYLEPWTQFRPLDELRPAIPSALWMGSVCRALSWDRIVSALPSPYHEQEADTVPERLRWLLGWREA
ncbi:MAG TPA: phosphotransferase [Gaiellaceae bacterium]|nr:phosphotransferase [Gaiellaceae bacterium]